MDEYPEIYCIPPEMAEVGDSWVCPDCARKFHYVFMTIGEDPGYETCAWYTSEIGF